MPNLIIKSGENINSYKISSKPRENINLPVRVCTSRPQTLPPLWFAARITSYRQQNQVRFELVTCKAEP
jgi:hypothetical protein